MTSSPSPVDSSTTPVLTPAEMSERTGVTLDTLRYYETEGLLGGISRAANGHRRYSQDDVLWVEVLRCLRDTGMTIDQLRHYCSLGERGPVTKPERKRILLEHRALVEQQIEERRLALDRIDEKIRHYDDVDASADAPRTVVPDDTADTDR